MSEYTPREEVVNIRRLGSFDEPNPEAYLGKGALADIKANHPSNGKPARAVKEKKTLAPEEAVNIFRFLNLFLGAVLCGVGLGFWFMPAVGITVFGALLWVMGACLFGAGKITNDDKD